MTRDMGRNMLPALKRKTFCRPEQLLYSNFSRRSEQWLQLSLFQICKKKNTFGVLHHLCAYSQIKIRKIDDKKFSVFTAGSIFWPISRVLCVINEFGFHWFASFTNALAEIKIRKIGDKKCSVFTAGSIFWPISRIMGVINEFGFRWFASFTDALAAR